MSQRDALKLLKDVNRPLTAKDVAERLSLNQSSAARVLKRLEHHELVLSDTPFPSHPRTKVYWVSEAEGEQEQIEEEVD